MKTITIYLPDDKYGRLKYLVTYKHHTASINYLKGFSTRVIAEFDSETRFKALAAQGSREEGLQLLYKLDKTTRPGGFLNIKHIHFFGVMWN